MAGFEPAPQGLGGPLATVTNTFALVRPTGIEPVPPRWRRGMLPLHPGRTWDRCRSPAHRHPSVVKDPALASLVGGKGFEPKRSREGERGYGPSADHPHVPPVWRQRQDSNPDPRALEARMLPLHHAAAVTSRLDRFEDRTSPRPGGVFPLDARPKQKRPSRGSP
jgi:hypothetical protein